MILIRVNSKSLDTFSADFWPPPSICDIVFYSTPWVWRDKMLKQNNNDNRMATRLDNAALEQRVTKRRHENNNWSLQFGKWKEVHVIPCRNGLRRCTNSFPQDKLGGRPLVRVPRGALVFAVDVKNLVHFPVKGIWGGEFLKDSVPVRIPEMKKVNKTNKYFGKWYLKWFNI